MVIYCGRLKLQIPYQMLKLLLSMKYPYLLCRGTAIRIIPRPTKAEFPILLYNKNATVKNCMMNKIIPFIIQILSSIQLISFVIKETKCPKFFVDEEHWDNLSAFL